jgi:hypothetical protein
MFVPIHLLQPIFFLCFHIYFSSAIQIVAYDNMIILLVEGNYGKFYYLCNFR